METSLKLSAKNDSCQSTNILLKCVKDIYRYNYTVGVSKLTHAREQYNSNTSRSTNV